jgi:hypothetical protein
VAVKKYQIFISSTFADLQEERQIGTAAILDLNHIPAGMELFPAVDMKVFEYVKKVIDKCDYYLLIIGARYGSVDNDGISYTEKEFDYAVSTKKTVIALLHGDIENLPKKKFDDDPALLEKLNKFRETVKTGRMVRMWNNHDQLRAALYPAINKAIELYPAVGWVRGDAAASEELLQQYVQANNAYIELRSKYDTIVENNSAKITDLAPLSAEFTIHYHYGSGLGSDIPAEKHLQWSQIFKIVGPDLFASKVSSWIGQALRQYLLAGQLRDVLHLSITDMDINTIKIHLHALGLISIHQSGSVGVGVQEYINLTEKGRAQLVEIMAVRGAIPVPDQGGGMPSPN